MSDVVIASNVSLKVNRAISGATTVNANCYAIVSYQYSNGNSGSGPDLLFEGTVQRYFGPGQSIPSTITISWWNGGTAIVPIYYIIASGVEFINSP